MQVVVGLVIKLGVQTVTSAAKLYVLESIDLFALAVNGAMVAFFIIVLLLKLHLLTAQVESSLSRAAADGLVRHGRGGGGAVLCSVGGLALFLFFLFAPLLKRRSAAEPLPNTAAGSHRAHAAEPIASDPSGDSALPVGKTLPKPAPSQHNYNAPEHQQPPPAHVREVFARFDANGDGVLDATELRAAAAHLGLELDADGAEALLRRHDTDGSGFIDLAELAAVVVHLEELKASRESLEA